MAIGLFVSVWFVQIAYGIYTWLRYGDFYMMTALELFRYMWLPDEWLWLYNPSDWIGVYWILSNVPICVCAGIVGFIIDNCRKDQNGGHEDS